MRGEPHIEGHPQYDVLRAMPKLERLHFWQWVFETPAPIVIDVVGAPGTLSESRSVPEGEAIMIYKPRLDEICCGERLGVLIVHRAYNYNQNDGAFGCYGISDDILTRRFRLVCL